jgi:4-amino-4-deoxy-L-arabinose transferase-like glycosyltransferase
MLERSDWLVPTFNGELRTHKPILLYWLIMSAYGVWGVDEFAARFWSAGLSTGTALLTFALGCRLFNRAAGTWAACILSTMILFNVAARAATPDASLIFCSTLTLVCLTYGLDRRVWQSPDPAEPAGEWRLKWPFAVAGGVALGAGMLAKGPVGVVLPLSIWGFFLHLVCSPPTWRQRMGIRQVLATFRRMRPFTLLLVAAAVAAPWYVAVGVRTEGVWLREFFWDHNVNRAVSPMEGHRGNFLLYYPIAILVGTFPWSALTIPLVLWLRQQRTASGFSPNYLLPTVWISMYVVAFSCASTKLPSYVTPTYPAIALLCGQFVSNWTAAPRGIPTWWLRWSAATLMVVGTVLMIGLPLASVQLLPGEAWLGATGLILLVGGWGCWRSFAKQAWMRGMQCLATTSCVFTIALFALIAPAISEHQQITRLFAATNPQVSPRFASYGVHEPSWVFYAGTNVPFWHADEVEQVEEWLADPAHCLITTRHHLEQLREALRHPVRELDQIAYFLRDDHLVLIGATSLPKDDRLAAGAQLAAEAPSRR